VYGHQQQPGPRNHEGEKDDQSDTGEIETRNMALDEDNSTHYLSHVAGSAPGKRY
jgi:hypothetical protein